MNSLGNDRGRAADNGRAPKSVNPVTTTIRDSTDLYYGPDDPRWTAVEMIADAWRPALDASHHMGYEIGYRAGYAQAEHDMELGWHKMWLQVRAVLKMPTFAELQERRGESR